MGKGHAEVAREDIPRPLYVTSRLARGARWAVYFTDGGPGARPGLEAYLRTTYWRAQTGDGFELFDLSQPASQPPPPLELPASLKAED